MITLNEWKSIKWEDRARIIKEYKIGRSAPTKVVQTAPGMCVMADDGVRQQDLVIFENLKLGEVLNTLGGDVAPKKVAEVIQEAVVEAEKPKKKVAKKK